MSLLRNFLCRSVRRCRASHALRPSFLSTTNAAPPQPAVTYTVVEHASVQPEVQAEADGEAEKLFAVVAFSGKQFKVVEDDLLMVDRQEGVEVGEEVVLDDVLLVGSKRSTVIGRPFVDQASVRAVCEQHPKDKKTIVFKMKRRKGYKRKTGFRRKLTAFRILEINDGSA